MLDKNYIVGLVDGEGSFNIRINPNKKKRAKVELKFSLKLRYQDKEILYELQKYFGCGNVYVQNDKRKNHVQCFRFEVQNKEEIVEKIVPFFEKNSPKILSRKRDFELFKKVIDLIFVEPIDFEKINFYKSQMHWGSPYTGKPFVRWGTKSVITDEGNARQTNRVMQS
ncbi:MAG: LAGLIDADG family homing endonuclease [Candidatus Pacearchaeota archaeon]